MLLWVRVSLSLPLQSRDSFPTSMEKREGKIVGKRDELPDHFTFHSSGFYSTSGNEASTCTVSKIKQTKI